MQITPSHPIFEHLQSSKKLTAYILDMVSSLKFGSKKISVFEIALLPKGRCRFLKKPKNTIEYFAKKDMIDV